MIYFDDMTDKYGFGDGSTTPMGIDDIRSLYITGFNTFLEVFNSNVRVVAFNRPGLHNGCLIVQINKDDFVKFVNPCDGDELTREIFDTEVNFDDAYHNAYDACMEAGLDDFVVTTVTVDQEAVKDFLTKQSGSVSSLGR
jgi:hypothetical protein